MTSAIESATLINGFVFSIAVKQGGRVFARPGWQAATQAITSLLMLFFAAKLLWTMRY